MASIGETGGGRFSEHQQEPEYEYHSAYEPEPERSPHNGGTVRSVGSLLAELFGETSALVRAETTLARSEMRENARSMQRGATSMATGGAVLLAGLLALVSAAILALAIVIPAWLAALIVGVVITAIGMIMLAAGKRTAFEEGIRPERTLSSLGEMKYMARNETDRAMRKWR